MSVESSRTKKHFKQFLFKIWYFIRDHRCIFFLIDNAFYLCVFGIKQKLVSVSLLMIIDKRGFAIRPAGVEMHETHSISSVTAK